MEREGHNTNSHLDFGPDDDNPYGESRRLSAQSKKQSAETAKKAADEAQRELVRQKFAAEALARLKKLPPNPKFIDKEKPLQ